MKLETIGGHFHSEGWRKNGGEVGVGDTRTGAKTEH